MNTPNTGKRKAQNDSDSTNKRFRASYTTDKKKEAFLLYDSIGNYTGK